MPHIANEAEDLKLPSGNTHKNNLNGLSNERMGYQKQDTIRIPVVIICIHPGAV